jgi:hypothetical protein
MIGHSETVRPRMSRALLNRDYMLMMTAGVISSIGTKTSQIALPLLALGRTQSPAWAGFLGAAQQLPYLLFSLPAGAWVDRVPRKPLLVVCDLVCFALLGSIPLAYTLGLLNMPQLLFVVFIVGICTVLFEVAELAALPQVVHAAQLARARSISPGIEASAKVIGPSMGGFIVSLGRTTVSGSVLAAWLYRPERLGPIILGSLIIWALSALTLALAIDSLTLTIGWALTQLVWPVCAVAVVSYRLAEAPAHLQGRVISAFRALSYGAEPVGLALGGLSVAAVGPSVMFGIIGIGLLSCLGMIIRFSFGTSSQTTSPSE